MMASNPRSASRRRQSPRTYRAGTMKEALARVRRDLGGDAIILASREVRRRRLLGLGSRELIEVTAASTLPATAYLPAPGLRDGGEAGPRGAAGSAPPAARPAKFGQ